MNAARDPSAAPPASARVAGVVVLFRPDAGMLENIRVAARQVERMFICHNSPPADDERVWPSNAVHIHMNGNAGVAAALNAGIEAADREQFDCVLLLDQDTLLPPQLVARLLNVHAAAGADCIVAATYVDAATGLAAQHPVPGEPGRYCTCGAGQPVMEAAWAITSGTLLSTSLYRRTGPFRADFFMDHVDTEYCLRARRMGCRVLISCGEPVVHSIGRQQVRRFGPLRLRPSHHAAERRFTMARNGFTLAREYGAEFPEIRAHVRRWLMGDIARIVLCERGRIAKLRAIHSGWRAAAAAGGAALRPSMMTSIAQTFAAQAAPVVAAVLLIPALLAGFGIDGFGVLTLAWALIGYAAVFDLGIGRALTHVLAQATDATDRDRAGIIRSALVLVLAMGIAGALLLAAAAPWIVDMLRIQSLTRADTVRAFMAAAAAVPFVTTASTLRAVLEADHDFATAAVLRGLTGVATVLAPFSTLFFTTSLAVAVLALAVARALLCVVHAAVVLRRCPALLDAGSVDRRTASSLLRFGGWVTVNMTVGPLMLTMDRFIIGAIVSTAAVAHYATPFEIVSRLWVGTAAVSIVLFPRISRVVNTRPGEVAVLVRRVLILVAGVFVSLGLVLIVFAQPLLALWLGDAFAREATLTTQLIVATVVLMATQSVLHTTLQGAGRPDLPAKLNLLELPVYIILVIGLTYRFGIAGCALAGLLRAAFDTALLLRLTDRRLEGGLLRPHHPQHARAALVP